MLILGIESATSSVGCAIGGPDGVIASVHTTRPRYHAESLAPQIEFVLQQAGIATGDVDVVAVDVGPGLFTGLRVGITTAISVAFALGVPMVAANSLELLASAVSSNVNASDRDIHAMIDARRGEVFHARYRREGEGNDCRMEPAVALPDELAKALEADPERRELLLVGDGARQHLESFDGLAGVEVTAAQFDHPSASALVRLVRPAAERGEFLDYNEIKPLYLREPDAKANWNTAPKVEP